MRFTINRKVLSAIGSIALIGGAWSSELAASESSQLSGTAVGSIGNVSRIAAGIAGGAPYDAGIRPPETGGNGSFGQGSADGVNNVMKTAQAFTSSDRPVRKSSPPANSTISTVPARYTPDTAMTVSVTVTPDANVFSYVVEDQPPLGWTVSNINQSGFFDANNRKIKWGPFFDNTPRSLTYQVTPPTAASGVATFAGLASFDGTNVAITGQRSSSPTIASLPVVAIMATDSNASETAGDSGILSFTRTGGTEAPLTVNYSVSGTAQNAVDFAALSGSVVIPVGSVAVNLTVAPIDDSEVEGNETVAVTVAASPAYSIGPVGSATVLIADNDSRGTQSSAVSSLPSNYTPNVLFTVTIMVTPAPTVTSHVVEDQPPDGWTVSNIDQGGSFDTNNRKVKWGPFFDNTARILSYQVTPPVTVSGMTTFTGLASFDGINVPVSGQRSLSAGTSGAVSLRSPRITAKGAVQFTVAAPVGKKFAVEYATHLGSGQWVLLTTFEAAKPETLIEDLGKLNAEARFYRVRQDQ